jgi:hypothetical protein
MERSSLRLTVKNAIEAAVFLGERRDNVAQPAMRVAEKAVDPEHKAKLLSSVAQVLTEAGRADEGLRVLLVALSACRSAPRETILEVLSDCAQTLAAIDSGELLLRICDELEKIDAWF